MKSKSGYLYIISNEAIFPGWYKVGTTWNLKDRLNVYQTSDPFRNYKIEYSLFHPLFREAEKKIKESMKHFAYEIRGEWFKLDLLSVKIRLEEQLSDYENGLFIVNV